MKTTNTPAVKLPDMAQYLQDVISPEDLAKKLRKAARELSRYAISDDEVNGCYAKEMNETLHYLWDLADMLHKC